MSEGFANKTRQLLLLIHRKEAAVYLMVQEEKRCSKIK